MRPIPEELTALISGKAFEALLVCVPAGLRACVFTPDACVLRGFVRRGSGDSASVVFSQRCVCSGKVISRQRCRRLDHQLKRPRWRLCERLTFDSPLRCGTLPSWWIKGRKPEQEGKREEGSLHQTDQRGQAEVCPLPGFIGKICMTRAEIPNVFTVTPTVSHKISRKNVSLKRANIYVINLSITLQTISLSACFIYQWCKKISIYQGNVLFNAVKLD